MLRKILLIMIVMGAMILNRSSMAHGVKPKGVTTFGAPEGCPIPVSPDYSVSVNGHSPFVYGTLSRTGDGNGVTVPKVDQGYCYYDTTDASNIVTVTVKNASIPLNNIVIRPRSYHIIPRINKKARTITFSLKAGKNVMLDPGYPAPHATMYPALAIFANVQYANPPSGPNVIDLKPGYYTGIYTVSSNQTLYLEPGAFLEGEVIAATGATNVTIMGHGIIDQSVSSYGPDVMCRQVSDLKIDGIICTQTPSITWGIVPIDCTNVTINNVKRLSYKPNSDGIDLCGCSNVNVRNCFVRSSDDSIVVKGSIPYWGKMPLMPTNNVTVTGCVLWNDDASDISVGEETMGQNISNVTFSNIDVIGAYFASVININNGEGGEISNIHFNNIRVEDMDPTYCDDMLWPYNNNDHRYSFPAPQAATPGCHLIMVDAGNDVYNDQNPVYANKTSSIRNVTFSNISVTTKPWAQLPYSEIDGYNSVNIVKGVRFNNISLNGKKIRSKTSPMIGAYPWLGNRSTGNGGWPSLSYDSNVTVYP